MKILTAKYVGGRLEMPDGAVSEGGTVTALVPEHGPEVELTAEEQSQLAEAIAQAERDEGIDGWRLLEELKG